MVFQQNFFENQKKNKYKIAATCKEKKNNVTKIKHDMSYCDIIII